MPRRIANSRWVRPSRRRICRTLVGVKNSPPPNEAGPADATPESSGPMDNGIRRAVSSVLGDVSPQVVPFDPSMRPRFPEPMRQPTHPKDRIARQLKSLELPVWTTHGLHQGRARAAGCWLSRAHPSDVGSRVLRWGNRARIRSMRIRLTSVQLLTLRITGARDANTATARSASSRELWR